MFCKGNNLRRLSRGDFESLFHLRLLVLDNNNITEIEEDALGRMEKLEQLFLNENLLSSIPVRLPSASLTALYIESNRITTIRAEDFAGLMRLDQLHLARNSIDSIEPGAFDQLTRFDQSAHSFSPLIPSPSRFFDAALCNFFYSIKTVHPVPCLPACNHFSFNHPSLQPLIVFGRLI